MQEDPGRSDRGWLLWLPLLAVAGFGAGLSIRVPSLQTAAGIVFAATFLLLGAFTVFRASDGDLVVAARLFLALAVLQGSFGLTWFLLPDEAGLDLGERLAMLVPGAFFFGLLIFVVSRLPREVGQARRKAIATGREALGAEAEDRGRAEELWLEAERRARDAGIDPPTRDYLRLLIAEDSR